MSGNHFKEYNMSPSAVASLTEPTPDLQRNYRLRGMMDGIGQSDHNGRWKYNLNDLVSIWISDRLSQRGQAMDRRDALRIGRDLSNDIIGAFLQVRLQQQITGNRFYICYQDGHRQEGKTNGISLGRFGSLSELENTGFDRAEVIDLWRLARTIPDSIQALLLVAAEDAD